VKAGFDPDFWVKTLHPDEYWSATPKDNREAFDVIGPNQRDHNKFHDNMYCINPQETVEYMKSLKKPWIAFKVLAAGAIPPREGFRFAFEGGADFLCVGMFDFQVVEDVESLRRRDQAEPALDGLTGRRPQAWLRGGSSVGHGILQKGCPYAVILPSGASNGQGPCWDSLRGRMRRERLCYPFSARFRSWMCAVVRDSAFW
jgi:hypothetical protein